MAADPDHLSASQEDYLKAIYRIVQRKQAARAKDIVERLCVHGSSVTGALRALESKGLINYAPYDAVTLTPAGEEAARDIVQRHDGLSDFFVKVLGVDPAEADETACRMEHSVSRNILERLTRFVRHVESCPPTVSEWLGGLEFSAARGGAAPAPVADDAGAAGKGLSLNLLRPGQRARVRSVANHGDVSRRILDMGVTPGSLVEIRRIAPLGGPIEVRIKGYSLSLRKDEARAIAVEPV